MIRTLQLESEVGADGVLNLRVPLGAEEARSRVIVTIQPLTSAHEDRGDSLAQTTYGSCAGLGLEEPPDLPLQHRDAGS